jgi:hypothetical protein
MRICLMNSRIGEKDNERNISNKIARGSFAAVFFVRKRLAPAPLILTTEIDGDA